MPIRSIHDLDNKLNKLQDIDNDLSKRDTEIESLKKSILELLPLVQTDHLVIENQVEELDNRQESFQRQVKKAIQILSDTKQKITKFDKTLIL